MVAPVSTVRPVAVSIMFALAVNVCVDAPVVARAFESFDGDRPQEIAEALRKAGLRVWFDAAEINDFTSITRVVTEGLAQSKALWPIIPKPILYAARANGSAATRRCDLGTRKRLRDTPGCSFLISLLFAAGHLVVAKGDSRKAATAGSIKGRSSRPVLIMLRSSRSFERGETDDGKWNQR
jgi:hypothetical protein